MAVMLVGGACYFMSMKFLLSSQRSNLQYIAKSTSMYVDDFVADKTALMERISAGRELIDYSTNYRDLALMEYFYKFKNEFISLSYLNGNGREEVSMHEESLVDDALDKSKNPFFRDAVRTQKIAVNTSLYSSTLNETVLEMYYPKYRYFGNRLMYVLRGLISFKEIADHLSDTAVGKTGFVHIVDKEGRMLVPPEDNEMDKKHDMAGTDQARESLLADIKEAGKGFARTTLNGIDSYVSYHPIESIGASVMVVLPYDEFIAEPDKLRNITIAILIILGTLALCISIVFARRLTLPLIKLSSVAARLAGGDLSTQVDIKTYAEVQVLVESFNKMAGDLGKTTVSKDHLNNIFQSMFDSVIILSDDYTIRMVNAATCTLLGYREEELVGRPAGNILNIELLDNGTELNGSVIPGVINDVETVYTTKKGEEIPITLSRSMMSGTDGSNSGHICVAHDITERIKSQKQLAEVQNQLLDAAHKAGMAKMATGILHNLKNVLNSVNASAEHIKKIITKSKVPSLIQANRLLEEHIDHIDTFLTTDEKGRKLPGFYLKLGSVLQEESDNIREDTLRIEEKLSTMKGIIETQQEYARSEYRPEKEDIQAIIHDVLKIQKELIDSNGVHVTGAYDKPLRCKAHKFRLVQVLMNLVKNGVESMKENDLHNKTRELVIETGEIDDKSDFLRVTDNGSGITPENLDKIFAHGFSTKETGHGFGLHASVTSVAEMGGSISVESDGENQGASFVIKLPVQEEYAEPA